MNKKRNIAVSNAEIAAIFEKIADILEFENANAFRIRAYRNAARIVSNLPWQVSAVLSKGESLPYLRGIGADLAGKIAEIVATGHSSMLDRLSREAPAGLVELLALPGLGPKRAKTLYDELHVASLKSLQEMAEQGRIRALPGFGARTETRILDALKQRRKTADRHLISAAEREANALVAHLRQHPMVKDVAVAGSLRRARETIGDIDILATAAKGSDVIQHFVDYAQTRDVQAQGPTRATIVLRSGIQVDLRVVPEESYGAALTYFTGSKAHNIALRRLARERRLKINEYGVFKGKKRIAGETEESVYATLGLPWIAPELREDRGEIEAAREKRLPKLIELGDLQGDLHVHTMASDGRNSLAEMAAAAADHGLEYVAITEHSQHLRISRGLTKKELLAELDKIDRQRERKPGVVILKGIEVDILEDGALDLDDDVLSRLDLVIGAVHSNFALSRDKQTERLMRAMDHPYFTMLAHPNGRLFPTRPSYEVDMERVIRHAKSRGCFLELNAQPERLDLLDVQCTLAKEEGVLIAIASDGHSVFDYDFLRYGVAQARRGWLEKSDVLNTRPYKALKPLLAATMG